MRPGLYPILFNRSLLLDNRSDVAAGFSLRRLRTAYKGPLIRARRASDNAELDFAASAGFLDYATMSTWAGGNFFATTFYDQSGNSGRDLSQATAAAQPQIILAANGKPALLFDGSDDFMQTAAFTLNQPHSYNGIARAVTNAAGEDLLCDGRTFGSAGVEYDASAGNRFDMIGGAGTLVINAGTTAMPFGTRGAFGCLWSGAASLFEINAATIASFAGDAGATAAAGLTMGAASGSALFCNCEWQEFVSFNATHTSAQLKADNAAMRAAWGF